MSLIGKLVISHARHQPGRLALASLAVIASACVVVWVVSGYDALIAGFDDNASKYLGRYQAVIVPAGPPGSTAVVPDTLIESLRQDQAIAEVNPVTQTRVTVTRATPISIDDIDGSQKALAILGGDRPPINGAPPLDPTLVGTNASDPPYKLLQGTWFNPSAEEGVLSSESAKRLRVKVGDQVIVTSQTMQTRLNVVGIVEQPTVQPEAGPPAGGGGTEGKGASKKGGAGKTKQKSKEGASGPSLPIGRGGGPALAALYVPLALAEKINGFPARNNVVQIALKEGVAATDFRAAWEPKLAEARPAMNLLDFESVKAGLSSERSLSGKKSQAYAATGMALLAAVFIIFSTLSMGVSERARELAILRSIGLTKWQVAGLVFLESMLLALIGWIGGLVAGWALLRLASSAQPDLFPTGAELGWWCVLLAGAAAFGGALVAAILPAWRATRVEPLDAMTPLTSRPPARWPIQAAIFGLALIAINPIIVYMLTIPVESRAWVYAGIGYPTLILGFLLLTPLTIVVVEKIFGPLVAKLACLDRRLVTSVLSGNLWRTIGTTAALSIGLSLYVSTQTWGYSMLRPYFPGDWLPDALLAFQPVGLEESEVPLVQKVPGVKENECLPLAIEQTKLAGDITALKSDESAPLRQDNVVLFGLDPERAFGGSEPFLKVNFAEGSAASAVQKLKEGKHCLIGTEMQTATGLGVGDKLSFTPPNAPTRTVEYTIAGVVELPGWHWITKFSGVRRNTVRTAGIVFADYDDVRRDFRLQRVEYFWMNLDKSIPSRDIEASMQAIAERHAGSKYSAPGVGEVTAFRPTARLTTTQAVREAITLRADSMIWGMSQLPLITLLVTSFAVINTIVASVRTRRWEMGILRSLGVTRWGLCRLVLIEGLLIGLAATVLSLGFGIMAGWCGAGMAKYGGTFGGVEAPLVIPWGHLLMGIGLTIGACLLASLWPAIAAGRAEPLRLLQAGRGGQ